MSDKQKIYERWWLGKFLEDGRQIVDVRFHGPPSGVYGFVQLGLEDGTTMNAPQGPMIFRPRKKDLKVFERPRTICLVGSTHPKWKDQYRLVETELSKAGFVVVSVVWFKDELPDFEKHRNLLERIHLQKIRISQAVVLIHRDAQGTEQGTQREILFAIHNKIPVITFTTIPDTISKLKRILELEK